MHHWDWRDRSPPESRARTAWAYFLPSANRAAKMPNMATPKLLRTESMPASTPDESIRHLQEFIERSNGLLQKEPSDAEMGAYRETLHRLLADAFGSDLTWWYVADRAGRNFPRRDDEYEYDVIEHRHFEIREKNIILTECISELKRKAARTSAAVASREVSSLGTLMNILRQFHRFATQLRKRHAGRETLVIKDEYDVQDLLHALLLMHFLDVRPEEHAPSFAGANPRLDFLLKEEQIVVEVKKTRESLTERSLCDELLADIARYQKHPNCKTLVCFVYDPEGRLVNVAGLVNDLESTPSTMPVHVFVGPQH